MSPRPRIAVLAMMLLTVLALSVPGCGGDNPGTPVGGGGTKELDSGVIGGNNGTYMHTFASAGTYPYHCTFHGAPGGVGMSGTVIVQAGGSAGAAVTMQGNNTFSPVTVTIEIGTSVTWTNNTGNNHTVTSD